MVTWRGVWFLMASVAMLVLGIALALAPLAIVALTLLCWFGCEWLFFALRARLLRGRLVVERQVSDERGPVATLWAGRAFTVRVRVTLGYGRLPFAVVSDPVPFGVRHQGGETRTDGPLGGENELTLDYTIECPQAGVARFEGLRLELADYQGLFAAVSFLRQPVVLPVLPAVNVPRGGGPLTKRHNEVPPPGIHRLHRPGSGSELLDLRDYQPGDPPRTIAWKVSARRDKLITREFESEVPVRCVLFLDASSGVLLPSPTGERREDGGAYRPIDRLIDIAAATVRACATVRDMTGLVVFDETARRTTRPARGSAHVNRLMKVLGETAGRGPTASRADPMALLPAAYALAEEVYPDLLREEVNSTPAWLAWLVGYPAHTRHRRGVFDWLNRSKRSVLLWGTTFIPLIVLAVNVVSALTDGVPEWGRGLLGAFALFGVPLIVAGAWFLFLFSVLFGWTFRRLYRWRKRLAALLSVRYGLTPGGVEALMEDDDAFSLALQRFLNEHQVPYALPLYDDRGRYLPASPEKVKVLAKGILDAAAHGRDNELYVVLADLLDQGEGLTPLLQAVRVALGRHHQVVVIQPWPRGVPMPGEDARRLPRRDTILGALTGLLQLRLHEAFAKVRHELAKLGVPVVCAASDEPVALVLDRMERLRGVGGRR